MRRVRAFQDEKLEPGQHSRLSESNFAHLIKVLRLKAGTEVILFNGDGHEYLCTLEQIEKKCAHFSVTEARFPEVESPLTIEIGQGLSRGDRMDWAIQKSCELGVNALTPLFTQRSEVRLNAERQQKRSTHWQQVAISACEQSGRAKLAKIEEPQSLNSWLSECTADLRLILTPELGVESELSQQADPLTVFNPKAVERPDSIALLIGPEGGFDEEEVALAQAHGFRCWQLGPRVLRTETAPVTALSVLNYIWGDFSHPLHESK